MGLPAAKACSLMTFNLGIKLKCKHTLVYHVLDFRHSGHFHHSLEMVVSVRYVGWKHPQAA